MKVSCCRIPVSLWSLTLLAILFPIQEPSAQFPSFLKRQGRTMVDGQGQPVILQGVAFGNQVWSNTRIPTAHHGEADFRRVAAMNMNVIRFYLNYRTLESDAKPFEYLPDGWAWLDSNIAWARRHRVYLILNVHVPQGGFQSLGTGTGLWDVPANQTRLKAMWNAIAARYRDEPVIAGFDLLNEPGVPASRDQWKTLAQELVDTIRAVDPRRLLIVERTNSVNRDWSEDADRNFFLVKDTNTAYTFHFYQPFEFSHQYASWTSPPMGEGGKYPDSSRLSFPVEPKWAGGTFQNPMVPAGTTDWTFFAGVKTYALDSLYHVAKPVLASDLNAGAVWFDNVVLKEFDGQGKVLKTIPLDLESASGWYFWSADGKGAFSRETAGCHGGSGCFKISGTSAAANAFSNPHRLAVTLGHAYSIEGYMKGVDVSAGAAARLRVDFETLEGPMLRRDKAYLESLVDGYLAWGAKHDVPLYLGEFGVIDSAFSGGRGGLAWVSDMIDILTARGLSFSYHDYHEQAFGIYRGDGPVDTLNANHGLIQLFKDKLGKPAGVRKPLGKPKTAGRSGRRLVTDLQGRPDPGSREVNGRRIDPARPAGGVRILDP